MKTFWNAIAVVLAVDALAVVVFLAYLYGSDRLNRQRVESVVQVLRPTLRQEQQEKEREASAAALAEQERQRQEHLAVVAEGPLTTQDQLSRQQEEYERQMMTVQRLREEVRALQRQLDLARARLTAERAEIAGEREALQQALAAAEQRRKDEDFQHAVALYEQLKPSQTKRMFQELLTQERGDEVVEYLAAMQVRKAAAVLKEFKQPQEVAAAAALVQRLRERGIALGPEKSEES